MNQWNLRPPAMEAGPATHTVPRGAMAGLALATLLASLGTSIANIALPSLTVAFHVPFAQVRAVVVAYLAAMTASVFIAGHLGDRYGLKPMLLFGLALFAAGALLAGTASSLTVLIGARAVQGTGASFLMTLSMALMRETAGRAPLGRAMGLLGTVSAVGTALGPTLGGVLIPWGGWRSVFLVQAPLALLTAAMVAIGVMAARGHTPQPRSAASWRSLWRQVRVSSLTMNLGVAAVMMSTLVVGPFYLGVGLGLPPAQVGLVMSVGPFISIVAGVPAGRLVDGWGASRVLALGLCLMTVGALLLATLAGVLGMPGYVIAIAVLTPGYQLFQAANNTATLVDVPPERRGAVSGLLGLSRNIGLVLGASVMGAVFEFGVGTSDVVHAHPVAMVNGLQLTFGLAALLMLATMFHVLRFTRSGSP